LTQISEDTPDWSITMDWWYLLIFFLVCEQLPILIMMLFQSRLNCDYCYFLIFLQSINSLRNRFVKFPKITSFNRIPKRPKTNELDIVVGKGSEEPFFMNVNTEDASVSLSHSHSNVNSFTSFEGSPSYGSMWFDERRREGEEKSRCEGNEMEKSNFESL
jgi:hypothetical protein